MTGGEDRGIAQEDGEKRHATVHRMTRRCLGWDYCARAIYQITLVQRVRRMPLLARLEIADGRGGWVTPAAAKALGLRPEQVAARVALTPLGEAILAHWKRIGEFTPEIRPLYCQIMPDHLHAILEVTRPMARPLGNAIGGFKTGCEKICRKLGATPVGERLWAEGFQDTILLHAGQLGNMFHYLADNARRLAIRRLFPDLFRVAGEVILRLAPQTRNERLAPQTRNERLAPQTRNERLAPQTRNERLARPPLSGQPVPHGCAAPSGRGASPVPAAPAAVVNGHFSALGNRFLLDRPLVQVQVSRRDFGYRREPKTGGGLKICRDGQGVPCAAFATPAFREKCDALLSAAKRGAVLISPCASDGEREIARLALEARLDLVALRNKSFSPLQKPSGRAFDACADGRLLLLAPITWPFVPGDKPMTRADALVLNRLAQLLAGAGAAEINYHGATFGDIDPLALRAVRGEGASLP